MKQIIGVWMNDGVGADLEKPFLVNPLGDGPLHEHGSLDEAIADLKVVLIGCGYCKSCYTRLRKSESDGVCADCAHDQFIRMIDGQNEESDKTEPRKDKEETSVAA